MAKSRVIRVTPNLRMCLKLLKAAVEELEPGDTKTKAEGALDYLTKTFAGKRQPGLGKVCPLPTLIINV